MTFSPKVLVGDSIPQRWKVDARLSPRGVLKRMIRKKRVLFSDKVVTCTFNGLHPPNSLSYVYDAHKKRWMIGTLAECRAVLLWNEYYIGVAPSAGPQSFRY